MAFSGASAACNAGEQWHCSSVPCDWLTVATWAVMANRTHSTLDNVKSGSNKALSGFGIHMWTNRLFQRPWKSVWWLCLWWWEWSIISLLLLITCCYIQNSLKVLSTSTASTNKVIATHHRCESRAPSLASPHQVWSSLAILLTQSTQRARPCRAQQRAVQSTGTQHDHWHSARLPSEWLVAAHLWGSLANQCPWSVLWPLLRLLLRPLRRLLRRLLLRLLLRHLLWWSELKYWLRSHWDAAGNDNPWMHCDIAV